MQAVIQNATQTDIEVYWKKSPKPFPFQSREGQCCCVVDKKLFIFGGVLQGEEMSESNDLIVFDADLQTWEKIAVKGPVPPPRISGSLVSVGRKLYLFGGLSHMTGWFNDFQMFDTESLTWSEVNAEGSGPSPRDKLQACAIGGCIYYFGGFGPKLTSLMDDDDEEWEDEEENDEVPSDQEGAEFGWFNDLYVYDTASSKWSQPMQMNLGVPSARAAHGMCAISKKLIIFGGKDMEGRQNGLHIFNTDTRKWDTDLTLQGKPPAPRSFHSVTAVGRRVVVIGGRGSEDQHYSDMHILDLDTKKWLQTKLCGDVPSERGQHSVAVVGNTLILHGGSTNFSKEIMQCQDILSDTYLLSTADLLQGSSTDQQNGKSQDAAS